MSNSSRASVRSLMLRTTVVLVVVGAWLTMLAAPAMAENAPPVLATIGNKTVSEGHALTFDASATDPDLGDTLTFSLGVTAPAAATIDPVTGWFAWTPMEADGPSTVPFDVVVTDASAATDSESITVTVTEVNVAPVLASVGAKTVKVTETLAFTMAATDADLPPNTLTFSLTGAPSNVTFDTSTGAFSWTPTETQAGRWSFRACISDGLRQDCEAFVVDVHDGNRPPVIDSVGASTTTYVRWGEPFSFGVSAHDPDEVSTALHFYLDRAPSGASITSGGTFRWTPSSAQIRSHSLTIVVVDNGAPQLTDQVRLTIVVQKRLARLDYEADAYGEIQFSDEMECYGYLIDASSGALGGTGIANAPIRFEFGGGSATATTDVRGEAETGFLVDERAGTQSMRMSYAGNALYEPASYSGSISIHKEGTRLVYTGDRSVNGRGLVSVKLSARMNERWDGSLGHRLHQQQIVFEILRGGDVVRTCTAEIHGVSSGSGTASCTRWLAPGRYHVVTELARNPYYASDHVRTLLVVG